MTLRTAPAMTLRAPAWAVAVALGIVYVVWGSTYLGIRVLVSEAPPLSSAGARYVAAAVLLGGLIAARRGPRRLRVSRRELASCALVGLLLPALGNGMVSVGEHLGTPSGVAALLVAAVPLWVVVYRTVFSDRPRVTTLLGVLLGFAGLAGLVAAQGVEGDLRWSAMLVIVFATACWSFGSWSQPRLPMPRDPFVATVYEMLAGGTVLLVGGFASGERWHLADYSWQPWVAWAYLVVFGSVVAFSAYVWVLQQAPISLVATYAYVNPVVAVFLGWAILSEPVTGLIAGCGAVVVLAVAVVIRSERPRPEPVRDPVPTGSSEPSPDEPRMAQQPARCSSNPDQALSG